MIVMNAEFWFWVHMIVLGYTLGSDFVVDQRTFYLIGASDVTPAERTRLLKSILLSDQHPRMGLILFIATGAAMESLAGRHLPPDYLPWLGLLAGLWLIEIWLAFLTSDKPWGRALVNGDIAWRYILGLAFLGCGFWSLLGDGPFDAHWISVKYILLGVIIAGGVTVRFCVRQLQAAWPDYQANGSSPRFEATLKASLYRAISITWTIWMLYLVIAWLTLFQPWGLG